MSLFQVREWWGVKGERGDEFTPGALVVGNVDNDASGQGALASYSMAVNLQIRIHSLHTFTLVMCPQSRS